MDAGELSSDYGADISWDGLLEGRTAGMEGKVSLPLPAGMLVGCCLDALGRSHVDRPSLCGWRLLAHAGDCPTPPLRAGTLAMPHLKLYPPLLNWWTTSGTLRGALRITSQAYNCRRLKRR